MTVAAAAAPGRRWTLSAPWRMALASLLFALMGVGVKFASAQYGAGEIVVYRSLMGLVLKRGTLWGALYIFIWDPLVRIMPGNLQRFTFLHYGESIAGSRAGEMGVKEIFAQAPVESPVWVALLVLH